MEEKVKQMIRESLEKRLFNWGRIDNILPNDVLINRWLTCIVALGYNDDDAEAASQDIFELQSRLQPVSIEDIRARVCQVRERFGDEIAAFLKYIELLDTADEKSIIQAVLEELESVEDGQFIV